MKIIFVKINESKGPDMSFVTRMLRLCSDLGISPPAYVRTSEGLFEVLKSYKDQEVVMFTNFPPDDSYSNYQKPNSLRSNKKAENQRDNIDAYSQSILLFSKAGSSGTFREVHFFTCAAPGGLNDEFFCLLFPGSLVKVQRIENCFPEMPNYEAVYEKYIMDRVKDLIYQFR